MNKLSYTIGLAYDYHEDHWNWLLPDIIRGLRRYQQKSPTERGLIETLQITAQSTVVLITRNILESMAKWLFEYLIA